MQVMDKKESDTISFPVFVAGINTCLLYEVRMLPLRARSSISSAFLGLVCVLGILPVTYHSTHL
jgi:hypothetical protein